MLYQMSGTCAALVAPIAGRWYNRHIGLQSMLATVNLESSTYVPADSGMVQGWSVGRANFEKATVSPQQPQQS